MNGENVVLWDGGLAANRAILTPTIIGITCVWFDGNHAIQEADILFNDQDFQWNTTGDDLAVHTVSGNLAAYALADGDTLTFRLNGGPLVTVTFMAAQFTDITMALASEVRDAINAAIVAQLGALAGNGEAEVVQGSGVGIRTNAALNGNATIEIVGGTANAAGKLAFPVGVRQPQSVDVETMALHEIGHFLGIHHTSSTTNEPNAVLAGAVMHFTPPPTGTKRALQPIDVQALNFVATPDLGDAPDPGATGAPFNRYQSLVHGTGNGRVLNGLQLTTVGTGPVHLFGFRGPDIAGPPPQAYSRDRFEWLGANIDDSDAECESRQPDADQHDDGVAMPDPLIRGKVNRVRVTISHSAQVGRYVENDDVCLVGGAGCVCGGAFGAADTFVPFISTGPDGTFQTALNNCPGGANDTAAPIPAGSGRDFITSGPDNLVDTEVTPLAAAPPTKRLHLNGYFDFPSDARFAPGDLTLWWSGTPAVAANANGFPPASPCTTTNSSPNFVPPAVCAASSVTLDFDVFVPFLAKPDFYSRFRLDYGEDEGRVANNSGNLAPAEGVAQFGEVEDHPARSISRRHYQCYETPRVPFTPIPDVPLDDQLGDGRVDVVRLKRLCNPADKNGEDPDALLDDSHLAGYLVEQTTPFVRVPGIEVTDQFGTVVVRAVRPELLLVPSAKSLTGPPPPIATPPVDHFKCYRIRGAKQRAQVGVADQFGFFTVDVKRPFRLCVPASKAGEGILDPAAPLTCYKVRDRTVPRFRGLAPIFIENQFGPATIAADHPRELCVPAVMRVPPPTP